MGQSKPALIYVFASWCGETIENYESITDTLEKYRDRAITEIKQVLKTICLTLLLLSPYKTPPFPGGEQEKSKRNLR